MKTLSFPTPERMISSRHAARGFSLLELSIILAVIGAIIAAVTIGRDVQRNAVYQRISSDFVQGWALAYDNYVAGTGIVPGDNAANPTGRVNQGTGLLCGSALINAMQAAGIALPEGRANGYPDHQVYLDSNGNPQDVQICFNSVNWTEPDASAGNWLTRSRNVMVLVGLTPALANMLDSSIDGHVDATLGRVRESTKANSAAPGTAPNDSWSVDDRVAFGATSATSLDEDQVAVVTAYFKMTR